MNLIRDKNNNNDVFESHVESQVAGRDAVYRVVSTIRHRKGEIDT